MTVRKVRIGEILALQRRPVSIDPAQQYREIGIRSFGKGMIHQPIASGAALSKLRYFELPLDALVLSNIMAWEGAIAVSSEDERAYIASSRFLSYVPIAKDEVDVRFVCAYFLSDSGFPQIQGASPGTIARNRTLNIDAFANLTIPLPDIEEQRRIAARLAIVSQIRDEVFQRAKDAHRRVRALRDVLCRRADDVVRLGEVLVLRRAPVEIASSRSYEQIGIRSFGRGLFHYAPTPGENLSKVRYFEVPANALVVSNIMAWEGAIATSTDKDADCIASHRFLCYVPTDPVQVDVRYLCSYLLSASGFPLVQAASPGSIARNHTLGIKAFEDLAIPLPRLDEQRRIASLLDRAYDVLRHIESREKLLDALIASALNHAFAGLV